MKNPADALPEHDWHPSERSTAWTMICLSMAMLSASMGVSIPNVALPILAETFRQPLDMVQWVVLAYLLALTVSIVLVGRLGDRVGPRRVFMAGLTLFAAASLGCALAGTVWLLIAARVLQGIGGAVLMALTIAMVRDAVPAARTGRAMGVLGTMSAVGTALGPSLGGVLLQVSGWQALFVALVVPGLGALLLARRGLPANVPAPRQEARPDWLGALFLALTLTPLLIAVTGSVDRQGTGLLVLVGMSGLLLFLRTEARSKAPIVPLSAFQSAALSGGMTANIIVSAVMMTTLVVGPFYLALGLDLQPALIGLVMAVGPALSAFSGVPAGLAVDRFGAGPALIAGLAQMSLAAIALAFLPGQFGLAGYLFAIALLTPAYQLVQAANNTAVMTAAGESERGGHSGLLSLSRNLGLMTGASIMGVLFARAAGTVDGTPPSPEGVQTGLEATFGIAGLLIAATALLLVFLQGIGKRRSVSGQQRPTPHEGNPPRRG